MDVKRTGNTSGEILLPSKGVGEWVWQVTAREPGTKYITLRLFAPGPDNADVNLETFREQIEVEVGSMYVVRAFIKDYAVPLGVTVPALVVGGSFLVRLWRKRQKAEKKEKEPKTESAG